MSYEDLGPAPDIDTIDTTKMDFGNDLPDPKASAAAAEPSQEELAKQVAAANPGAATDTVEEEEEQEEEAAATEEQPRDDKGRFAEKETRIPKSRFDEAVGKEREAREAAERRAAELERQLNARQERQAEAAQVAELEKQIEGLESKHAELLLDGDTAGAAKIMREIRMAERQIATAEAEARAAARTAQALEADRLEASIARVEADYPQFNPDSELFDEDLVGLVLTKQRALIAGGMRPSEAIEKASRDVATRFIKAPEPAKEEKGLSVAKQVKETRTKEAVAAALAAQSQQPASTKEVGLDSDKLGEKGLPDVSKMSADEFDALPESTKARLRGDII